jgi:benzoyl-CoA reductase/2-hydroxyglutaryl-CoA dehydratase subunit BcrC/BadD/HgdB
MTDHAAEEPAKIFLTLRQRIEEQSSWGYPEIAAHLPADRIPVGYFCPYVPEELLYAARVFPFRLMGLPLKISHAQAHLPSYCCHLVKSSLEGLLQGDLGFLKGIVFSQTCDSMKGLADIWGLEKRGHFQFNLMVPSRLEGELARIFYYEELKRLTEFLKKESGPFAAEDLSRSIHLFNQIREGLAGLYRALQRDPSLLTNALLARIIEVGYFIDRAEYLGLLQDLLKALPAEQESAGRIPLYLIGNMTHSPDWFSLLDEAGALVVGDDLCSGGRTLRLMTEEVGDPWQALVDRYFKTFFCSTKYMGPWGRKESLLQEVEDSGAKGAVFLFYKFCEPHYFDYPDVKQWLEEKGIPILLLEIEGPTQGREQLKIRIQAFIEMLG